MFTAVRAALHALPPAYGGLALGLAGLGLGLEGTFPLNGAGRNLGAIVALPLLVLMLLRYLLNTGLLREELCHPLLGCLPAAGSMALMLCASTVCAWSYTLGLGLWFSGILLQAALLLGFAWFQARRFQPARLIPSWFLPFVGLIMAAATVPDPAYVPLARALHLFGGGVYLLMLPVMVWRLLRLPELPAAAKPTVAIMAAPPSLFLVGYLNLSPQPSVVLGGLMLAMAMLMTFSVYCLLPGLLTLPFSPAFASYTFPLVISATALYRASDYLPVPLAGRLRPLGDAEMILAALVTAYVCIRFVIHALGPRKSGRDPIG